MQTYEGKKVIDRHLNNLYTIQGFVQHWKSPSTLDFKNRKKQKPV
jgi:hypothetical protein